MRIVRMSAVVAGLIPFAALAADTVGLTAGRWEEVATITSLTAGGKAIPVDAIPSNPKTKFRCLTAEEALDPAKFFLKPDRGEKCEPGGTVSGGRVTLIGSCTDANMGQVAVTGSGTYQPKSYEVNVDMLGAVKGAPMIIKTTIRGRHVGVCTGTEAG